jgi:glycosyltransferase involved in cell wall biosynthesis
MTLRIAHFVQRYPPALGGSEVYFQRLSRYLVTLGHQIDVWTTTALDLPAFWSRQGQTLPPGESCDQGVRVRRFACDYWPGRRFLLKAASLLPLGSTWRLLTLPCNPISLSMRRAIRARAFDYDIVHASAFPYAWPIVCARDLARQCGAAFFLTPFLHLGDRDNPQDATRQRYLGRHFVKLLCSADRVFAQTDREAEQMRHVGVDPRCIVRQGMGVEVAEVSGGNRDRWRAVWGLRPSDVVIGHLANLSEEKGSCDLLRAAAQIWSHDGQGFVVALAGPEMPNFRRFWSRFPFQYRVMRLGAVTEEDKRDFFAAIDLFVLPSRSDSFGLVLLEAWANRLPNIAYRAGGPAEVIRDGVDGFLVPCGSVKSLAEAIQHLVKDPAIRRKLGQAGFDRLAEFAWTPKLDVVVRECEQMLARKMR